MASRTPSRSASRGRTRSHSQSSRRRSASPGGSASPKTNSRSRSHSRVARDARNGYRSDRERSRSPAKSTKIVVEKLTKNVMEDHLRELFGSFGVIREIDMPMNTQFNTNRGTAYIMYDDANDAETAMIKMHEGQLDGATLNVSAVLPHRKFSPSPPPARRLAAHLDRIENNNSRRRAPPPPPPRRGGLPPPRYRSPPPRRDFSPPRRYRGGPPGVDTWRPRSYSRSRSRSPPPYRRSRSRSFSRSLSRSPPPRRGASHRGRDSPPPPARGGGRRRRSPSYSSYDSYSDRSRSLSRDRGRGRP